MIHPFLTNVFLSAIRPKRPVDIIDIIGCDRKQSRHSMQYRTLASGDL